MCHAEEKSFNHPDPATGPAAYCYCDLGVRQKDQSDSKKNGSYDDSQEIN
jgi:hypothetical protein